MSRLVPRILLLLTLVSGIYLLAVQQVAPAAPVRTAHAAAAGTARRRLPAAARNPGARAGGAVVEPISHWRHLPEPLLGALVGLACMLAGRLLRRPTPAGSAAARAYSEK